MNKWREIESAPKDGRLILLLANDKEHGYPDLHALAAWGCTKHMFSSAHCCTRYPTMSCEFEWIGSTGSRFGRTFSYWMPLPPPPASADLSEPDGEDWREFEGQSSPAIPDVGDLVERLTFQIAQLRHGYVNLVEGKVKHQQQFAAGIISPAIKQFEQAAAALEASHREVALYKGRWKVASDHLDKVASENERLREALEQIASCEQCVEGDVVSVARAALEASQREIERLRTKNRILKQALSQAGDSIELQEAEQRGYARAYQEIERLRALLHEAINSPHMDNDADIGDWYDRVRAALERKGT